MTTPPTTPLHVSRIFRVNARQFFLTYPQCDIAPQDLANSLRESHDISRYCIGRERHSDGGNHLHAYIAFNRKVDVKSQTFFDCQGYHPHIEAVKNKTRTIEYCRKEKDFVESLPEQPSWAGLLKDCSTQEEFMSRVKETFPRDYILNLDRLIFFCNKHFKVVVTPYVSSFTSFNVNIDISVWVNQMNDERPRTLLLVGPSRSGKTEWARSIGCHMYFNNLINLDDWNPEATYIVFDDFDWKFFPNKKAFWGAQKTFVLTDKYRKKHTVHWGKPMIYICNEDQDPFLDMTLRQLDFFERNCIQVRGHRFY